MRAILKIRGAGEKGKLRSCKSLVAFFLALSPSIAFNPSSPWAQLNMPISKELWKQPGGHRAAVPSMGIELKGPRVSIPQPQGDQPEDCESCGSLDLEAVADLIKSGAARDVIVMVGAGISTSAGIPDFRTPGTGLYDNLHQYGLPKPEAMFNLDFFLRNTSKPFYQLCNELWPGQYEPTLTHYFIRLLYDKGMLLRCYTQNIDSLETEAGLPPEALVAAHGNFDTATVYLANKSGTAPVPIDEVRVAAQTKGLDGWNKLNAKYGGLVKPDIVFFGEQLPVRFYDSLDRDFPICDLLLVLGTSLAVQPFAALIEQVSASTPRLLVNRKRVGDGDSFNVADGPAGQFVFDGISSDGFVASDCDDAIKELVKMLDWQDEFDLLVQQRGALAIPERSAFQGFRRAAESLFKQVFPERKVIRMDE